MAVRAMHCFQCGKDTVVAKMVRNYWWEFECLSCGDKVVIRITPEDIKREVEDG